MPAYDPKKPIQDTAPTEDEILASFSRYDNDKADIAGYKVEERRRVALAIADRAAKANLANMLAALPAQAPDATSKAIRDAMLAHARGLTLGRRNRGTSFLTGPSGSANQGMPNSFLGA